MPWDNQKSKCEFGMRHINMKVILRGTVKDKYIYIYIKLVYNNKDKHNLKIIFFVLASINRGCFLLSDVNALKLGNTKKPH